MKNIKTNLFPVLLTGLLISLYFEPVCNILGVNYLYFYIENLQEIYLSHKLLVISAYALLSLTLTIFAFPSTLFLAILAGMIFPLSLALSLSMSCFTLGSLILYHMAFSFRRLKSFRHLAYYLDFFTPFFQKFSPSHLIFLHFFFVAPFWAINMGAGLLRLPILTYIWTTVLGILPLTYLYCLLGHILSKQTPLYPMGASYALLGFFLVLFLLKPYLTQRSLLEI